jgi:hypothetical protein
MTLILASVIDGHAVIAADRRTKIGVAGADISTCTNGEDDKLFKVGNYVIASFGGNPLNFHTTIPCYVRNLPTTFTSPRELATHICQELSNYQYSEQTLGMLIGGFCTDGYELLEVTPQINNITNLLTTELCVHSRGVGVQPVIMKASNINELKNEFMQVFLCVSSQTDSVGSPFDFATLTAETAPTIERFPLT